MEGESKMKRLIFLLTVLVAVVAMQSQSVRAQDATPNWNWIYGRQDPKLFVTGVVVGAGATAAYWGLRQGKFHTLNGTRRVSQHNITQLGAYAVTTVWCASAFPIIGTLVMQRALTTREVYTGMANCVVPILGGWAVEAMYHGQAWYEK
jgi:hypothetical protein